MPRTGNSIRLALDWDGTLTKKDTLHLVSAIGYTHNRDAGLPPWDDIVQAYIADYTKHAENYIPTTKDRRSIAEESDWLASLKDVERRSIERVRAAGVFKGVTKKDVVSASRAAVQDGKLQLRPNWKKLFALARGTQQRGAVTAPAVSIISVNWSATFIRACLETAALESEDSDAKFVDSVPIFANELPLGEVQPAPYICTSADKLARFKEIHRQDDSAVVYVSDSATDFDCLVAADVGICVRDDPMGSSQKELKETLERVGYEVTRLSPEAFKKSEKEAEVDYVRERGGKQKIWWVADLEEITNLVGDGQAPLL